MSWLKRISANNIDVIDMGFTFSKPLYSGEIESLFGQNVKFGCVYNYINFDNNLLRTPVLFSNQYLNELIGFSAKKEIDKISKLRISTLVENIITRLISEGENISVNLVCSEMYISRQTLHRKLASENSNFQSNSFFSKS